MYSLGVQPEFEVKVQVSFYFPGVGFPITGNRMLSAAMQ